MVNPFATAPIRTCILALTAAALLSGCASEAPVEPVEEQDGAILVTFI